MRRVIFLGAAVAILGACAPDGISAPAVPALEVQRNTVVKSESCEPRGSEGWDFNSMMYRGRADGADFIWDCLYSGDSALGRSHLIVNYNAEYLRAVAENGQNPPYINAAYTNQWNGKAADGTDQLTFIKLVWTPWCASIHIEDPRICVGQFEVILWKVLIGHEKFTIVKPYSPIPKT